jgi:hypothetical protein
VVLAALQGLECGDQGVDVSNHPADKGSQHQLQRWNRLPINWQRSRRPHPVFTGQIADNVTYNRGRDTIRAERTSGWYASSPEIETPSDDYGHSPSTKAPSLETPATSPIGAEHRILCRDGAER